MTFNSIGYFEKYKNSITFKDITSKKTFQVLSKQHVIEHFGDFIYKVILKKTPGKHHVILELVFLGHIRQHITDLNIVIAQHGIAIENQTNDNCEIKAQVSSPMPSRKDFTHLPFVTIDGEDAKDFDDAVCLVGTNKVYVAIADVAHYVLPNSSIDLQACQRGNSFYFPGNVFPMLPTTLCDDLCSLRPNENRLAIVVELEFDQTARVIKHSFHEAVICSKARLNYNEVQKLLSDKYNPSIDQTISDMLLKLFKITQTIRSHRMNLGSIDFDLPETKIILDDHGKVYDIQSIHQNDAQKMIEELMLIANKTVAQFLLKNNFLLIHRVHDGPDQSKIFKLLKTIHDHPSICSLRPNVLRAMPIHQWFLHLSPIGKRLLLKTMSQAYYSTQEQAHFGLAFDQYIHFTSPIRRYADLINHRLLKDCLHNKKPHAYFPTQFSSLHNVCVHISQTERTQQKATWDYLERCGARLLCNQIGQLYDCTVNHIGPYVIHVTVKSKPIEGMIKVDQLRAYVFEPRSGLLKHKKLNKMICIGDALSVVLKKVDLIHGTIEFSLKN